MRPLYINALFEGQRTTGQQRYAVEVLRHISARTSVTKLSLPTGVNSPVLSHLWAHVALPLVAADGVLLSMTARSPVAASRHVLVVHDLFPITHPEWYSRTYAVTHGVALKAQMRSASVLAAVSEPVADQLRRLHPTKKVIVAPNAPSHVFQMTGSSITPDLEGPSPFLLAVGSADPRKNFRALVHAYGLLDAGTQHDFPLLIVGGESRQFRDPGTSTNNANVRHLGYVDDETLSSLYAGATAVVVPSLDEGFGLPVVEALAAGARVVASDIPVFRWVAEDRIAYFDPRSTESMVAALRDAISHPAPAEKRAADSQYISRRFAWEHTADELLKATDVLA